MHPNKRPYQPSPRSQHPSSSQHQGSLHTYFSAPQLCSRPHEVSTALSSTVACPHQSHKHDHETLTQTHQATLLNVGMRIRKSIADGYKRSPLAPTSANAQANPNTSFPETSWKPLDAEATPFSSQESCGSTATTTSTFSQDTKRPSKRLHDREEDDAEDADDEGDTRLAWASIFARPKAKAVSRRRRWRDVGDLMEWEAEGGDFEDAGFLVP
ncbi:MAG: hypothetical protein M1828_002289 [Chrysothrix sp. TS-e1954]|nr:MAG: hypothetical protein M1828_002289 [Chrysothrix sp. TS-e1954]